MGGIDLFDSRRKSSSSSKKSKKWWLRIYYFLLDTSVTNAYVLYRETPNTKALTQKEFILQVVEYLMGQHNSRKRQATQQLPSTKRLSEWLFPSKNAKKQQCTVCRERRRTIFYCNECSPEKPVPLCPTDCFRIYVSYKSEFRPKMTSNDFPIPRKPFYLFV
jgi:hypothetical protein